MLRANSARWTIVVLTTGILVLGGLATVCGFALARLSADNSLLSTQIVRWEQAQIHEADWGQMRFYFRGQTGMTDRVLVAVAVVEPGKAVHRAHRHAEEEYLVVVSGEGTWQVGEEQFPAKQGDILYVQPWVYHGLVNTGERRLIFLVFRYVGKGTSVPPRPDDRPDEL
jgi:mannose-6-phosphate isomerase-like protein (cupin superfamily)